METPFLGVEAVQAGVVRKHELRSRFSALFPGVYLPRGVVPTFRQRAEAAWLWSGRDGVLACLTAARLYGARWIDDVLPIELNWSNGRPPDGIRVVRDRLAADERCLHAGLPVTTVLRTAFDLGRMGRLGYAVARLDALGNAVSFKAESVADFADSYRGARGIRQLRTALALHDAGAQSPKETWLRLLIIAEGFPKPQTQIAVRSGAKTYYLDMGWEDVKIAVEYDGDHHRTNRAQFAKDITRLEDLAALGWVVIRVAADTPRVEIIARIQRAWAASKVR